MRNRIMCVGILALASFGGNAFAADAPKVKFIRLEKKGVMISIAELEVLSGGKNIAKEGKATQSTTGYDGDAARGIDGNTDGEYTNNSVTHTDENEENPWWQVELKEAAAVQEIVVWNRTDCCADRMDEVKLILLDADKKPVAEIVLKEVSPSVKYKVAEGKLAKVEGK